MTNSFTFCVACLVIVIAAISENSVNAIPSLPLKRVVVIRRFHPSNNVTPLQLHDLMIDGQARQLGVIGGTADEIAKSVDPDLEFEAVDNSFIKHIVFKATNQTEKNIKYVRFMIHFYSQEGLHLDGGRSNFAFALDYGHYPMPKDSPSKTPLSPGDTATIAIDSAPEPLLAPLREAIFKLNAEIVRVAIVINTVTFEDGTEWYFDGKLK